MLFQLPHGKVVEMSCEQFLELSDEEIEYLIAFNYGDTLENPWSGSIISHSIAVVEYPDEPIILQLTDIPRLQKLEDLDIEPGED